MQSATLAQVPGTQRTVVFPEDHEGPFTLRDFLAQEGIDPSDFLAQEGIDPNDDEAKPKRDISVNGTVTENLDMEVPDGAIVLLTERVKGA